MDAVLEQQIEQCRDVLRISRLVLLVVVAIAAAMALCGPTRALVGVPVVMTVPVALNLLFHRWQLAKLRFALQVRGQDG